jgi:hypothetical protein
MHRTACSHISDEIMPPDSSSPAERKRKRDSTLAEADSREDEHPSQRRRSSDGQPLCCDLSSTWLGSTNLDARSSDGFASLTKTEDTPGLIDLTATDDERSEFHLASEYAIHENRA